MFKKLNASGPFVPSSMNKGKFPEAFVCLSRDNIQFD